SSMEKRLINILDNFIDWNISRQIVWGIRIPAYQCQSTKKWFIEEVTPKRCAICGKNDFKQDEDTFDTWFSSAQWPFATLETQKDKNFYKYFYPTTVMETGYDILRAWVARMIMIGVFATNKPPFKNVFLHGLVRDKHGQKMSKSKGNVVNPMEMVDKYGADALRAALIFGVKEGGDLPFAEEKVIGMRNFCNKVWNIGRFMDMNRSQKSKVPPSPKLRRTSKSQKSEIIKQLEKEFKEEKKKYLRAMDGFRFSQALGLVYEFIWHRFADHYIEQLKDEIINGNIEALNNLEEVYLDNLKMLHPFIPFVTEAGWQVFKGKGSSILESRL
ncbi:class I tRNA ligase family protein, partial [Patescibacteria group bacterium]|nr:class I tRNA ligase family protein [Patescibacteria group bacterium]